MITEQEYRKALQIVHEYEVENKLRHPNKGTIISRRTPIKNVKISNKNFYMIRAYSFNEQKSARSYEDLSSSFRYTREKRKETLEKMAKKNDLSLIALKNINRDDNMPIDIRVWFLLAESLKAKIIMVPNEIASNFRKDD